MQKLFNGLLLACASLALALPAAHAANAQNEKMTRCNAEAKGMRGDARKAFMKQCLSAKGAAAPQARKLAPQQQKMADCNGEARHRGLGGAKRSAFMQQCLKGGVETGSQAK